MRLRLDDVSAEIISPCLSPSLSRRFSLSLCLSVSLSRAHTHTSKIFNPNHLTIHRKGPSASLPAMSTAEPNGRTDQYMVYACTNPARRSAITLPGIGHP